MVSSRYLTDKQRPPSEAKRAFDQKVIPAAIDAAAWGELVLEKFAQRARRQPFLVLGAVFGAGFLVSGLLSRQRR